MSLSRRNRRTLAAVSRVLIPSGGSIEVGAADVGLAERIAADVDSWPPRVRRRIRALLIGVEYLPLVSGRLRRFTRLSPDEQCAFLEASYHHHSAARRMIVAYLKQLCYAGFLSVPEVERAMGYRYQCHRPRAGVRPGEQVHH